VADLSPPDLTSLPDRQVAVFVISVIFICSIVLSFVIIFICAIVVAMREILCGSCACAVWSRTACQIGR
jgi:hypothetical protein